MNTRPIKVLVGLARALMALFVDDELLAIGIIAVVAVAAVAAGPIATAPLAAGGILLIGSVLVLVACVVRTTYRK